MASGLTMPVVRTSPEIRHGLRNIIENAIDFAATRVNVTITVLPSIVVLVIADDGPGFAYTVLGELGEPYVSTRRADGGMGLGLFIAKTLLERTGAQVTFHNAVSGGAEVAVQWPRDILGTDRNCPMTDTPPPQTTTDRRLLIVDDDAIFRDRLARAMEKRGFVVATAANEEGAIEAINQHQPTHAVLDLRLEKGFGLDIVPVGEGAKLRCAYCHTYGIWKYRHGCRRCQSGRCRLPRQARRCR